MISFVWMTQKISGCWINSQWKFPRYQSTSVIPTSSNCWRNAKPFFRNAVPHRRAAKHLGHMVYRETFLKSRCVIFSTLSAGIESMVDNYWGTASYVYSGEKWKPRTKSRYEMPVWTVSQKFSHLQWRRLFKELYRILISTFPSSLRQQPLLAGRQGSRPEVCTCSHFHGSNAMDQRSGVGWFGGWIKIFVIYSWYFNAEFWSIWCKDCVSTEHNHP